MIGAQPLVELWAVLGVVLLQGAQPMPLPELQPDVSVLGELAWAALNPAVIAVAYLMGRQADQMPKVAIAAFAAALAGIVVLWLAAWLHLGIAVDIARGAVGVFVMSLPFGLAWAWLGRRTAGAR